MNTAQDVTTFIECVIARENNNFDKVLNEVARGFKNRGFFLKHDWAPILITIFGHQILKEFRCTVLPNLDNSTRDSADKENSLDVQVKLNNLTDNGIDKPDEEHLNHNIKIGINGFEGNELSVMVLFTEDNETIKIERNDTQPMVHSTSDVLEDSHDNDVIPESRSTKQDPIPRLPSEDCLHDVDIENTVDFTKACEMTGQENFSFLETLTGADWTRTCAKVNSQSSEKSHVKFVTAFDKYKDVASSIAVQNKNVGQKPKLPENSIAAITPATEYGENISSAKDLLTTVSSSSSNIALSILSGDTVAVQRDSTIAELVVSPISMPSNCEFYESQPTDIREDMEVNSQELPKTTTHLSNENQFGDLPVNLMHCKVKIAKLDLNNYDTQIGTRKNSIKKVQVKSALRNFSAISKDTVLRKLKEGPKDNSVVKRFCCEICGKKFIRKYNIKQHMAIHTDLRRHLMIHTGEKPFACDVCHKSFGRTSVLSVHKRCHTGEKRFACDICHKAFNQFSNLSKHKTIHTGEKRFACDICHKAFNQFSNLSKHKTIHTGEKRFACDICAKAFNQSSTLSRHKTIHTGEKPFACDVCHKSFSRTSNLSQHKTIHTGEKPFACDVCHKSFSRTSNLSQHKTIHTGEKPFACDVCLEAFANAPSFSRHKKIHAAVKSYSCAYCEKSYIEKGDLKKHLDKCYKEHHFQDRFEEHSKGPSNFK